MAGMNRNVEVYDNPQVVSTYDGRVALQPSESYLFDKYIPNGSVVLDIGMGAGRTAPFLAARASRYVGVDYAPRMVEAAQKRFPELTFFCANACDLGRFADASFDIAVFSFNGIGSIGSDEDRACALLEISRILKPGGLFIFSLQNALGLVAWPIVEGRISRELRPLASAAGKTVRLAWRRLLSGMLFRGAGYAWDHAHGGISNFFATPDIVGLELGGAGLGVVEVVNGYYPLNLPRLATPWYYYVARKAGQPA